MTDGPFRHEAEALAARHDVDYRVVIRDFDAEGFAEARSYTEHTGGAVAAAVTNDDGDLLFVRSEDYGGWVLPGGAVDPGERLRAAAAREVREETGVDASIDRPLVVLNSVARHEGRSVSGYFVLFEGTAVDGTVADDPGLDDERITQVRWCDSIPAPTGDGRNVGRVHDVVADRFDVARADDASTDRS